MSCEEIQTQLPTLLDGEVTSETAAVIEAHLAECAHCSEVRDEIRAVLAMTLAWNVKGGEVLAGVQHQIRQDEMHSLLQEMHSLLQEMKQLRKEVEALRSEVSELKIQAARRVATHERESSVLRFPYAAARDRTRPIL